jgi:hypothetical protein
MGICNKQFEPGEDTTRPCIKFVSSPSAWRKVKFRMKARITAPFSVFIKTLKSYLCLCTVDLPPHEKACCKLPAPYFFQRQFWTIRQEGRAGTVDD